MISSRPLSVYNGFIGVRVPGDMHARLERFSGILGRRKSDVIRYLLLNCLNSYEGNQEAIEKIKQELY